jgi:hypothetical protein
VGDRKHPGGEFSKTLKLNSFFQDFLENVLNKTFTEFNPLRCPVKEAKERFVMPFEQQPQPGDISRLYFHHQFVVRQRIQDVNVNFTQNRTKGFSFRYKIFLSKND